MDSVNYWYRNIYNGFLKDLNFVTYVNDGFFSGDPFYRFSKISDSSVPPARLITFFDQEPLDGTLIKSVLKNRNSNDLNSQWLTQSEFNSFVVTSEKSSAFDSFVKFIRFRSIYYFFHAAAALDWYRNYWKNNIEIQTAHEYLFVSYQHIVNPRRAHRIDFLSRVYEKDLFHHGLISFKHPGLTELENIIASTEDYTKDSHDIFQRHKHKFTDLYIDTQDPHGALSTSVDVANSQRALVQVVTETVFYPKKLHLTEKIFKPIVCKQPFLLLSAVGNLKYFREYGFKTFGDYWDEDYDDIEDPGQRVEAVVKILEDLSRLTPRQRAELIKDMSPILEHNWNHFYYDLKHIVAQEFVDNIKLAFKNISVSDQQYRQLYKILTY
jgi:hypothetical protein